MDNKTLTPEESLAVIAAMIEKSKSRNAKPDLRLSVFWAIIAIATAIAVLILVLTTKNPLFHLLWFAIPIIGIPANFLMKRKRPSTPPKTYIDSMSDKIWGTVGLTAILGTIVCIVFNILGYPQAWLLMLLYAFIIVGFGTVFTGIILKENSYVFGGLFSVVAGGVVAACIICNITLLLVWVLPLYILCFLTMFIIPAVIINKKLTTDK